MSSIQAASAPPSSRSPLPEPWLQGWPPDGLESVPQCPLCGHRQRVLLHGDLRDTSFRVSRGRWNLWRCLHCTAGYLDPRPSSATIADAYASYYTHEAPTPPRPGAVQRVRRWLSNGYSNVRYGSNRKPATRLGVYAAGLLPLIGTIVDRELRHLPSKPGPRRAVLDVGCGDGGFLVAARDCGWDVLGLEPDPMAAAVARERGVDVIAGGLEALQHRAAAFDVVTLSHVIEHLPDPVKALCDCRRLLKPGGQLWVETPNLDSLSHVRFGPDWRGLEAPRHLVLFTPSALAETLRAAGFAALRPMPAPSARRWMFERSHAIAQGRLPDDVHPLRLALRLETLWADLFERPDSASREFLTVVAARD